MCDDFSKVGEEKAELGARLNQEVNSIGYWFNNERKRRREKLEVKNTRAEEGMVSFKDISMEEEEEDTNLTSLNSEESSSIDERHQLGGDRHRFWPQPQ